MGRRIIISEEEKNNIKLLYEDFIGISGGNIEYETSSGQKVEYKLTHPASDFEVINLDMNNGTFKIKGNFIAGTHEGVIPKDKLDYIKREMDKGTKSFNIKVGEKNTELTFVMV